MRVFMIGMISKSGGVSTHTKEMLHQYDDIGIEYELYNFMSRMGWRPGRRDPVTILDNVYKVLKLMFYLPLKFLAARKRIDLIHVQSSGPIGGFLPAMMGVVLKKMSGKRLVITFHHSKTDIFINKHPKIFSWVLKNSDRFIVVSNRQKAQIRERFGDGDLKKIIPIPNGFDPEKFRKLDRAKVRKKLNIPEGEIVLVNIAWLMEKKGQKYLIMALDEIVNGKGRSDVKCYIIGKGPLKARLNEMIEKKDLSDNVVLTDYLPFEDMNEYLNAGDIFVLPSLDEGNPIVMFEALGMGLPFVGTDVGGIQEIIDREDYGYTVSAADHDTLRVVILKALEKKWDRDLIREYSKKFTWRKIAEQTIEQYETITK